MGLLWRNLACLGAYFAHLGAIWGRLGAYLARLVAFLASPGAILRRLGAISGSLGAYLARFDAYLPRLGVILERPGAISGRLGTYLARLDAYLPRLGAILGRLGRILASQNPPKIAPRTLQDAPQDEVQHKPQLKTLQGPFLMEKPLRNSKKKPVLVSEREARLSWTNGCTRDNTSNVQKKREPWIFKYKENLRKTAKI